MLKVYFYLITSKFCIQSSNKENTVWDELREKGDVLYKEANEILIKLGNIEQEYKTIKEQKVNQCKNIIVEYQKEIKRVFCTRVVLWKKL